MASWRRGIGVAGAVALAAVAAACGSTGGAATSATATAEQPTAPAPSTAIAADTPAEPGALRITGEPSLARELVRVADAQGLFAAEGLSLGLLRAQSAGRVVDDRRSGRADGAIVSSADAVRLAADDPALRIVLILDSATTSQTILGGPAAPDVAGLAGRRVALVRGGDAELLLRGALARVGVPFAAVQPVDPGPRSPGTALFEGQADAAVVGAIQAAAVPAASEELAPIATAGDQPGLVSQVLVVRGPVLRARPGQVLAFVRGWQALYLYERDNADAVVAAIANRHALNLADVALELGGIDLLDVPANAVELLPGGEYYDRTIGVIAGICADAGWAPADPDPQRLLDGSFAQAVASAR